MCAAKEQQKVTKAVDESDESDLEPFPQSYLDELLEKAKAAYERPTEEEEQEEDILTLEKDDSEVPLPPLEARRLLPTPYLANVEDKSKAPSLVMDSLLPRVASTSQTIPLTVQPLVSKDGKLLTKREIGQFRRKEKGPGYFDLPEPDTTSLPKIQREYEALRLRNALDPKRFYRKEVAKKELPKQIAIGTIIPTKTPFGTRSADNLTRAERKRTIVDELVDDMEAHRYAKRKYDELHSVRKEKGRDTLNRKKAARKPKW